MLTQDELKSKLQYNPNTGIFIWKIKSSKNVDVGNIAGCKHHTGYIHITINKKTFLAHRLAWLYVHGHFPLNVIDHLDCDRSNNKISNIREATYSENQHNRSIGKNSKSKVKGVIWNNSAKKWIAQLKHKSQYLYLGRSNDFFETCCMVISARNKIHGNFSRNA